MIEIQALGAFTEPVQFYLNACMANRMSERTVIGKEAYLRCFALWALGNGIEDPEQVRLLDAEQYKQYLHLYRKPYSNGPLDIATIRNRLTAVKTFYDGLYDLELIETHPLLRFKLPKVPRRQFEFYLTLSEVKHIMKCCMVHSRNPIRDRAILEVLFATGMRRMELAQLSIGDIDPQEKIVLIKYGKGLHQRRVPLPERAQYWIDQYIKKARPKLANLQSGRTLFLSNQGRMFNESKLSGLVRKALVYSNIDKKGATKLYRHTLGTLMLQNGADIRIIQEILGHADISTTQIYVKVVISHVKDVYEKTHPAALEQKFL